MFLHAFGLFRAELVYTTSKVTNMKRLLIPLGIVLLIVLIGGMGYLGFRSTQAPANTPLQSAPQTVLAARGDVHKTVTAPGKLVGTHEVSLDMGASGQLAKLNVRPGEAVQTGQVLAALDTTDLELEVAKAQQTYLKQQAAYSATIQPDERSITAAQAAVNSAYAAYQAAQQQFAQRETQITVDCADFKNASDELARAQAAYDSVANDWKAKNYAIYTVRKDALDNALAAYDLAKAQCNINTASVNDSSLQSALASLTRARSDLNDLTSPNSATVLQAKAHMEQARLDLEDAQQQLADATLVAPFDGVVLSVDANLGEAVVAHSPLITLADPRAVEVESTVIEEDMSSVKLDELVNLFFDAKPDASATGRVARIIPQRTSGDRLLYPIYISIDSLPQGLIAGMTVDASVVVDTRSDVLRLPRELVRVRSDNTAQIKVWNGQQIEQRTITIGLRGDSFVEVLNGLREGEQVVSE
jgi:HlyD family secretion protein